MHCCFVVVLCCFVLLFFSSADRESEIEDRKLESWTSGNFEDCCFVVFKQIYMRLTFPLDVQQNAMVYQRLCMLLMRFW